MNITRDSVIKVQINDDLANGVFYPFGLLSILLMKDL